MRKKFFIKPKLQIRHLVWTLGVVVVAFVTCYFVFETIVGTAVMSGPLGLDRWIEVRSHLRTGFVGSVLILLVAVGFENYLFFHSVIGPIYALEKGLKRLSQGEFGDVTRVRESDELGEVISAFEEMKKQILMRIESQEKTALLLASELDRILSNTSLENIQILKTKLKEIRDQVEKKAA